MTNIGHFRAAADCLGKKTNIYLNSAKLGAIASRLGHIPTVAEHHEAKGVVV